jgi:tRNA(Ile)-lysidine synthase
VRPLLDCRRAELRALLQKRGVAFIEDETNGDVAIPRNRVRAELLPALAARFNPAIVDVLAREAELARETWAWLESAADEFDGSGAVEGSRLSSARVLDVEKLKNGPPPLRRLVLWRAMNEAASGRPVAFTHVDAALRLLDTTRGAIDAPGHRVERNGSVLVLTSTPPVRSGAETAHSFQYPLAIPGEVQLAEAACIVAVEVEPPPGAAPDAARSGRGAVALVRRDLCAGSLAVRNRRPGDRFRPVGLAGCKKLQDYFVDRKVARKCRDRVPLVVDESDRIVWVAGYGIDEAFRVTEPSQAMLLLRLTQV